MKASEFADWVLKHFDLDCWMRESTMARRLAGLHAPGLTAPALLAALIRAGWVEAHPRHAGEYCIPAKCWVPKAKPK